MWTHLFDTLESIAYPMVLDADGTTTNILKVLGITRAGCEPRSSAFEVGALTSTPLRLFKIQFLLSEIPVIFISECDFYLSIIKNSNPLVITRLVHM